MAELDFKQYKDKTPSELVGMVETGKIKPSTDAESEMLRKLASTEAGSAERDALFAESAPAPVNGVPPIDANAVNPQNPATGKVESDIPAPAVAPVAPVEEPKPEETETLESLREKLARAEKLVRETENRHRGTNGKLGIQLKDAEKRIKALEARIKNAESIPSAKEELIPPQVPVPPKVPNPKNFESAYDEAYLNACDNYERDYENYTAKLTQYTKDVSAYQQKLASNLADERVRGLQDKMDAEKAETIKSQEWNNLWKEVEDIQSRFGLKTTIPVSQINDYVEVANSSGKYSLDEVNAAKAWLDALPPNDKVNFDEVSKAINGFYDFSDGVPKKTQATFEGFLYNTGMTDWFDRRTPSQVPAQPIQAAPIVPQPKQEKQYATPMSAASIASSDTAIRNGGESTSDEIRDDYMRLSNKLIQLGEREFYKDTNDAMRYEAVYTQLFGEAPIRR